MKTFKPRKHYSQMKPDEVGMLVGFVRSNIDRIIGAPHYYDRASERHFELDQIKEAIAGGKPVEVSKEGFDIRALFRRTTGPNAGTCAVVSLRNFNVITAYYNAPDDNHDTLNHNLYRWPVNVVDLVKGIRKGVL